MGICCRLFFVPEFLDPALLTPWAGWRLVAGLPSRASGAVERHPWPLPTGGKQAPLQVVIKKSIARIAKHLLGAWDAKASPIENHSFKLS